MQPRPDSPMTLAPGIRRIIAPNPSPFTYWGTNSYLYGEGDLALIDPGPRDPIHAKALLDALKPGERISHILVTHSHLDHSPLARDIALATGAPILAFGSSEAGLSAVMQTLKATSEAGDLGGGEGADPDFAPDILLKDGEVIEGKSWALQALWTPGHFGNHLSFAPKDAASNPANNFAFCGDLVMGWSTSIVSPPDGDLTDFMASCERTLACNFDTLHPGHGDPITDPTARLTWLINHRRAREAAILQALQSGPQDIPTLTRAVYTDIEPALLPAAARNVFAHLIDLHRRDQITAAPHLALSAQFALI
jgi:glyoxylase-like metal-dependent hydrolase (beta-lactamase superfamily II)